LRVIRRKALGTEKYPFGLSLSFDRLRMIGNTHSEYNPDPVRAEPVEALLGVAQHFDRLSRFDELRMHGHFDRLSANGIFLVSQITESPASSRNNTSPQRPPVFTPVRLNTPAFKPLVPPRGTGLPLGAFSF
jgi:hypothetical protein